MGGARSTNPRGRNFSKRGSWLAILVGVLVALSTTPALAADAPELEMYQALAFTDVNQTGDAVVLIRYELDQTGWATYLNDSEADTSLQGGVAFVNLYSGNMAQVEYQQHPPRIGHGLAGIYIPSDAPDFATGGISVCIESDDISFTNPTQACINILASSGGQEAFANQLVQTLLDLQLARTEAFGTYVNSDGLITQPGRVFAVEALPIAPQIAYQAFQAGSTSIDVDLDLDPTSDLGETLEQSGSSVIDDLNVIGLGYFGGASGTTLFFSLLAFVGVILGGAGYYFSDGNVSIAGILFGFPMLWGMWFNAPSFATVATVLFVLLAAGGIYATKKVTQ